jgi:hypothetical protein
MNINSGYKLKTSRKIIRFVSSKRRTNETYKLYSSLRDERQEEFRSVLCNENMAKNEITHQKP